MPINKNEITKEMFEKAMQCNTAEDLIALAKTEGVELSQQMLFIFRVSLKFYSAIDCC